MDEIKQESLPGMSLISSIAVSTSFLHDVSLVLCPNGGVPVFPIGSKRLTVSYVRPAHGSAWRKWASAPSLCSAAHLSPSLILHPCPRCHSTPRSGLSLVFCGRGDHSC